MFDGLLVLQNKLKEETTPVILSLLEAAIRPVMITGTVWLIYSMYFKKIYIEVLFAHVINYTSSQVPMGHIWSHTFNSQMRKPVCACVGDLHTGRKNISSVKACIINRGYKPELPAQQQWEVMYKVWENRK